MAKHKRIIQTIKTETKEIKGDQVDQYSIQFKGSDKWINSWVGNWNRVY